MANEALKVRSAVKKRKPNYRRSQAHQFKKLNDSKWRRPKGMGNKVRRQRRGKLGMLQVGYKSPKAVRGFNREGLQELIVSNVADLGKVSKEHAAVISKTVGSRKRLEILNEAKKKGVQISNIKDIDSAIKKLTKVKKAPVKKTEVKAEAPKKEEKKTESKGAKK